jgi:hypothetical protein
MARGARRLLAGLVLWALAACALAQGISKSSVDLRLAESSRGLPDEIDAMAAQLRELAPGLWESNRGALFLAVSVGNRSAQPLPMSPFGLQLGDPLRSDSVLFHCSPERGQRTAALPPRAQAPYLCRGGLPPVGSSAGVVGLVAALRIDPEAMSIESREPAPRPVESRPTPHQEAVARAAARPTPPPRAAPAPSSRSASMSGLEEGLFDSTKVRLSLLVILAFAYYASAKVIGNRQARTFFWILGTAYAGLWVTRAMTDQHWLLLLGIAFVMEMVAVLLPMGLHWLYDLVTSDWDTIKQKLYYLLLGLIAAALSTLLGV